MKSKIIIIAVLIIGIFLFYKYVYNKKEKQINYNLLCTTYNAISKTNTNSQLSWILANSNLICNAGFYNCIIDSHKLTIADFNTLKGTNTNSLNVTWANLKSIINGNCTKYIGFTVDANGNPTVVKTLSVFTTASSCYSFRLFNAIGSRLQPTDVIHFLKATNNKIIFSVNNDVFGYNYSNEPLNVFNPL